MIVDNLEFHVRRTGNTAAKGTDRLGKSLKNLKGASASANKGLGGLLHTIGRLAKMMVLRQAIRAVMKALKEGLENAYMFNSIMGGEMSAALDRLKSASVQATGAIGSAFGELLANVAPLLIRLLELIGRVADGFAQLMAVLGGRSKYTKAVASSEKWAKATEKGAKAAKEWKNQLMGFDEINRLEDQSDNGSGSGGDSPYDGAFELADATNEWAKQLRELTMNWWNSLNLDPIINAWDRLKTSVGEFVELVDGALYWAYTNVLLPLGTWTIEEGLPSVMHMFASAVELLTDALKLLKPYALWVFEEWLKPFGDWIGDHFISAMWRLQDAFVQLRIKINEAKSLGEFLKSLSFGEAVLVGLATAVTTVVTAFMAWRTITSVVSTVGSIIGLLSNPVGIAIAAITALVVAGIGLYQSWDTIIPGMKKAWGDFKDWVHEKTDAMIQTFENFMRKLHEKFVQPLLDWIASVQEWFDNVKKAVSEAVSGIIGKLFGVRTETDDTTSAFVSDMGEMSASIFDVYNNSSLLGSLASAFENLGRTAHAWLDDIGIGLQRVIGFCQKALSGLNAVANKRAQYNEDTGALYATTPEAYNAAVNGYASGGFPDEGQLFMAREGGIPEMVGTIGNRTAVATNADIVTAVSNGVYSAVVSAMGSPGGNNTPVNIYLDGSIIAKSTTKYQRQFARAGTM